MGAVAVLATAACAGTAPDQGGGGGGELVFAVGGADAAPGGTHRQIAELWAETHPDAPPLRIEQLPDPADEQRQQLSLELNAAGTNFDILGMDVIWTGEFAVNQWVESLEDVRDQIEPVVLEGPFESATWDGTLWAAPYNSNAGFLYYRTDLISDPPQTWEEATQMGLQAAQSAGIAPFVGQGAQYEGLVVNYLEYFWGAGGELLGPEGTEVLYAQGDAATTALEFMRQSATNGFYAPGFNTMREEEARNIFQSGGAVFMRNWPYAYDLLTARDSPVRDRVGVAKLPGPSALGGANLAIATPSQEKETALDFIRFLTSPAEQRTIFEDGGYPAVLASVYEDPNVQRRQPYTLALRDAIKDARSRPSTPYYGQVTRVIQDAASAVLDGQAPAGTAKDLADRLPAALQGR
jgi:multiple sugar transport system substrate-binding protein